MSEISGDPARLYTLKLRINRRAEKTFVFTENDLAMDISVGTWELFVKKYPGDKKKVISLTLGNGLEIPIYQDDRFVASFTSAHTKLEKGEYYFELVRTDIEKTYLNGICKVYFGPEDNAPDNDIVTVDVSDEDVNVSTLQDITVLYNGTKVGTTKALNFVPGSNVTIDVQKVGDKINVTIASSGGGSSFTLASGNGTTANGSSPDLGGELSDDVIFTGNGHAIELSDGSLFVFATAGSSNGFDLSELNSKFQLSSLPAAVTDKSLYWNSATGEVTQGDPSGVFLGLYISLAALQSAYPSATSGQYAIVDPGSGTNAVKYIWDEDEGWVAGGGSGASVWGDLGGTLSDQTDLQAALNAKADATITESTHTGNYTLAAAELTILNAGGQLDVVNTDGNDTRILTFPSNADLAVGIGKVGTATGYGSFAAGSGATIEDTRGDLTSPSADTVGWRKTGTNSWKIYNGTPETGETTTTLGALINGASAKATPVDADMLALMDSEASNVVKKLSWANIKATLKTYFDTLYKSTLSAVSTSTASGTITLNMNSIDERMFVGSATFATPKTMALSNSTNAMVFNFHFEVTSVAAALTFPSGWLMSDVNFTTLVWTPPSTGKYEMGGSYDGTNWKIKIVGPFN
jgi:hypothetical protein